ncbi:hypothetical protein M514_10658 [Trichuris suis]|uniref:Uncharacterized protein n=1 Tax=Trichuris suis TaxID=68888 RepID=A0A085MY04_9BILA|nr:hypothetical protein M513_10658 [Trichuris suis]KFD62100.1 hypothetical protein M514_10658 [Trichuris suis]
MRLRDKCDSLHMTRVCSEPGQCAACSATADAANAHSVATVLFSSGVSSEVSHTSRESMGEGKAGISNVSR